MYPILDHLLNSTEIKFVLQDIENNNLKSEEHDHLFHNTFAKGGLPSTWPLAEKIKNRVQPFFKEKLKTNHTYTRVCKKDSVMGIHLDRPGLDVTVSVCIKRDVPWELRISHTKKRRDFYHADTDYYKQKYTGYDIELGQGVVCEGRLYPHWRERFIGQDHQSNIYTFFHYSKT